MAQRDASNIVEATARFARHSERSLANFSAEHHNTGDGGGGPPGGNDLERRVDKLDNDMVDIKVALARIEAKLDGKVDYKWLTVYVLGIAALILREEIARLFTG